MHGTGFIVYHYRKSTHISQPLELHLVDGLHRSLHQVEMVTIGILMRYFLALRDKRCVDDTLIDYELEEHWWRTIELLQLLCKHGVVVNPDK